MAFMRQQSYPVKRKARWQGLLALAVAVLACVYFSYYALYGDRGLLAQRTLQQEVQATEARLEKLSLERQLLEQRTRGLRPESLDADLIDQQAREQLGLTRAGEQVVITPSAPVPQPAPQSAPVPASQ